MSEAPNQRRMSASFRRALRAAIIAMLLGVVLGAAHWLWMEQLRPVRHYILFFQPFVLGYAVGRLHQGIGGNGTRTGQETRLVTPPEVAPTPCGRRSTRRPREG